MPYRDTASRSAAGRAVGPGPRAVVATALLAMVAAAAPAGDRALHLTGGGTVGFNWYVTDGAGFRWDISANGQVSDGTDDAYDGGMQLRLGGTYFDLSQQGTLGSDGREVEIGPWQQGEVQVYRRIYVDPKLGYCRWIDLFENTGADAKTLTVQYYSNLGGSIATVKTTTGKTEPTDKDWGIVTGEAEGSSRPAIVYIYASKGAKLAPRLRYQANSDSMYADFTVKVPAGKTVGLCQFHAQRRPFNEAAKFLQEFNPRRELNLVPPAVRRVLLNMGGATLLIGDVDLPRNEQHDLAVLTDESELLGKILNERFQVETLYGPLDLPAERVVGLSVPARDDPHVHLVLADGQIVAGTLRNAPLRLRLTNGSEMALPPDKLAAATFALSPQRPAEIQLTGPTIVLRCGQHLAFRREDLPTAFQTQHGVVRLDPNDLRSLQFDTPDGGLHRAIFRNGSVLSGLLTAEMLKLRTDLGPTLEIRRQLIRQLLFPSADAETAGLAELRLRNEDQLLGRIAESSLAIATQYGKVTLQPAEIAELQVPEEGMLGQVQVKLLNGTTVSGKYLGETLQFQIVPGPQLPIYFGHVAHLAAGGAATQPAVKPAPPGGAAPTPPAARLPIGLRGGRWPAMARLGAPDQPAAMEAGPIRTLPPPASQPAAAAATQPTTQPASKETAARIAELKSLTAELLSLRESRAKVELQINRAAENKDGKAGLEELRKKLAEIEKTIQATNAKVLAAQRDLATQLKPR